MGRPSSEDDRTLAQASGDTVGTQIARVFLSIVGEGVDEDRAQALTEQWIGVALGPSITFMEEEE